MHKLYSSGDITTPLHWNGPHELGFNKADATPMKLLWSSQQPHNMSLIMVRTTLFWFLHVITQLKWQRSRVPICHENQWITRALGCLQMFEIMLQNIQLSCNHVMKCNILNGLISNIVHYVLMRYISSKLLKTWPSWIGTSIILKYAQRYYLAVFIFYCSTSVILESLK